MRKLFFFCMILFLLSACDNIFFEAVSAPPPTKEGLLNDDQKKITLSKNVALAFECSDFNGPCKNVSFTVDDVSIAKIYPAYLDDLTWSYYSGGSQPATVFVVTGKKVGTTKAHFTSKVGDASLTITVK